MNLKPLSADQTFHVGPADSSANEVGLNLAVAMMKAGEKAFVYVQDPKYGFGERGNFSFPSVPPQAQLVYELELLGFDEPDEVSKCYSRNLSSDRDHDKGMVVTVMKHSPKLF